MGIMFNTWKFKAALHFAALIVSISVYWCYQYESAAGALVALFVLMYVVAFNLRRREIIPAVVIIAGVFFVMLVAISGIYGRFGRNMNAITLALALESGIYVLGSYILFRYHCNASLMKWVKASVVRVWIPQAVGISMVFFLSALPPMLALVELTIHRYNPTAFESVPFFYRNYEIFKNVSFTLIMLGVWSMMLDAHYVKERLSKKMSA